MKWIIVLIGLVFVSSLVFAGTSFNKKGVGCVMTTNEYGGRELTCVKQNGEVTMRAFVFRPDKPVKVKPEKPPIIDIGTPPEPIDEPIEVVLK